MGYHTEFSGSIAVSPPLNNEEREFLSKFNNTRRMTRTKGPYFVGGSGFMGQGSDSDVTNYNRPPDGQPGLWCHWESSEDGTQIEWDGGEKFYDPEDWMKYLINHFLAPGALAESQLSFLQCNHLLNGEIKAQGEDMGDRWKLVVKNNVVSRVELE